MVWGAVDLIAEEVSIQLEYYSIILRDIPSLRDLFYLFICRGEVRLGHYTINLPLFVVVS